MINDAFGARLLSTFNDTGANPVHLLFNQWWNQAPPEVTRAYVDLVMADPAYRDFVDDGYYAEPLDIDRLAASPSDSLGVAYHDWIVDNGLTAAIATDYRDFHRLLESTGQLDGMPTELRYAILRGFQVHDFLHVLTGYDASGRGEIALQAFSLAQMQFPYFGMWMSVVATQMTFNDPTMIVSIMDMITDGWVYGRATPNLMVQRWEEMLDEPLTDMRDRFGVQMSPVAAEMWARRPVHLDR